MKKFVIILFALLTILSITSCEEKIKIDDNYVQLQGGTQLEGKNNGLTVRLDLNSNGVYYVYDYEQVAYYYGHWTSKLVNGKYVITLIGDHITTISQQGRIENDPNYKDFIDKFDGCFCVKKTAISDCYSFEPHEDMLPISLLVGYSNWKGQIKYKEDKY